MSEEARCPRCDRPKATEADWAAFDWRAEVLEWRRVTGFLDPDLLGLSLSRLTVPEWTAETARVVADILNKRQEAIALLIRCAALMYPDGCAIGTTAETDLRRDVDRFLNSVRTDADTKPPA